MLLTQDSEATRLSVITSDLSGDYDALAQSVTQVFQRDIKMKSNDHNRSEVRRITRNHVFRKMKFVSDCLDFEKPSAEVMSNPGPQRLLLEELGWFEGYSDVEKAIRWNTYSKEVGRSLSNCRSTEISFMKKNNSSR